MRSLLGSPPSPAADSTPAGRADADHQALTVGVEEEFLLLDPRSGENVPRAEQVLGALPAEMRQLSRLEFRRSMLEMVTPVCTTLSELRDQLHRGRRAAADAADAAGAQLVAVGATPVADPQLEAAADPRFTAIAQHYGPIAHDPAVCGCHVHVGVPTMATAIEVCNHLGPWLPIVQALAANSPMHAGADTGYASWRSIQLDRWPSLGPAPYLESVDEYEQMVRTLIDSGVMLDKTMVLWHARPSLTYPTVEVRVADVCPTVDDTLLIAALVRALVATALDDMAAGLSAPRLPEHLLRAAHWNAARTGLDGTLIDPMPLDPMPARSRPAWDLVDELLIRVSPALRRHGDLDCVVRQLARLRREGNGAARQRRVHAQTGDLHKALAHLADLTVEH
jgi:carboxylate-amine ligase